MCDGCLLPPPWARHCRSYVLARSVPSPRSTVECLARTSSLTHHMRSVPCVLFVCFRGCGGSTPEEPPVFATQQDEAYQNPTQAQQIDDIKFSIARAENMAVEAVIMMRSSEPVWLGETVCGRPSNAAERWFVPSLHAYRDPRRAPFSAPSSQHDMATRKTLPSWPTAATSCSSTTGSSSR